MLTTQQPSYIIPGSNPAETLSTTFCRNRNPVKWTIGQIQFSYTETLIAFGVGPCWGWCIKDSYNNYIVRVVWQLELPWISLDIASLQ